MFTGIVTDLGKVIEATTPVPGAEDRRFRIATTYDTATIPMGASVACNGCCLTVVAKDGGSLSFDASGETLLKTTLGDWRAGARVNLERPMKIGDELGGHIVAGHVDGVATVTGIRPEGGSVRYVLSAARTLGGFVASKGSVALDGVSLTVNEVSDLNDGSVSFGVNIIPHTQSVTTFGGLRIGDRLNMEIDLLARYVGRLMKHDAAIVERI
ncbi:MAG: riboflavin synthase [Rhodospirillaceae bacterium]|nr:MAG: riboflavin synthase [Rhodospirillaceae bacterium]